MFSKQEAAQLKKEFWIAFGKSFPRKWLLYNTKIKDFSFKFFADNKRAMVCLDIEMKEELFRNAYFEKIQSLQSILDEALGEEAFFEETLYLDNGKEISRVWVECGGVSIFNKESWQKIFEFFVEKMTAFETVFYEYEDFIKDI
ncbi:DUF4268 domain-containing protein [Riemerella anatipestifer]|uniref:DUF4268 domain-containing protein n=1 Tax=Riemerella anatipestifer (strain ATCC 11845 / DSM 15868 / JCM 9532 / NCTC 11014) TaxID=693978 RepID=E4T977_RIEAD|nr:DUF4268 domain-containing protein [Riemerella anatipestifer]ADQ81558.1 hypothetical protein Riean_0389 [Riemerella anatipestifer ATCC 11845 = DSM 15868]AFD55578.1 hypothetical protein RA0C_0605 [Riemerella anatipestifer ATCC 11845 = DSM 15868]MDD1523952.1 DUF4268 domain-containing protein [Riemerella anatipestifer]MRM91850.1 DUF4268 domain-containing protein [Riemerella anatipestifer]MRN05158.1 DUF4268 domain-containing protein [Riemerella anatipestifer]